MNPNKVVVEKQVIVPEPDKVNSMFNNDTESETISEEVPAMASVSSKNLTEVDPFMDIKAMEIASREEAVKSSLGYK